MSTERIEALEEEIDFLRRRIEFYRNEWTNRINRLQLENEDLRRTVDNLLQQKHEEQPKPTPRPNNPLYPPSFYIESLGDHNK
jgi:regulator of replication initiation timing